MLAATDPGIPAGTRTRLIVEPARPVSLSVLPLEDPARAQEVSLESGIPEAVLRKNDAVVRQTHRRAGIVVLDVPEDRQATLRRELEAAGFVARPPKPVYALLNESVPLLAVQPVWRSGVEGGGIRVGIVDTGADRHPDFSERIVSYRDFTETGTVDDVGHGTHVAGIVAGAGPVYRGVAPRASLVIAKALSLHGGTEDTVLAALSWLSRQKVDVINLSLGGPGDPRAPPSREVDALTGAASSSASPPATLARRQAPSDRRAARRARSPSAQSTNVAESRITARAARFPVCARTSPTSSRSVAARPRPPPVTTASAWPARVRRRWMLIVAPSHPVTCG